MGRLRAQIGHVVRDAQHHKSLIGHEHMRSCRGLWASRVQGEVAAKKWMGGVCDLNLGQVALCERMWVIERGMNMYARSTRSRTGG